MKYEEFEKEFKKHHICGIPIIPFDLAYDSRCPCCEPDESWGWKEECMNSFKANKTVRYNHYWYSEEQVKKMKERI